MKHLWLRAEHRENEKRVGLTPEGANKLIANGIKVSVETSDTRIIPTKDYKDAGCEIVYEGSWESAPEDAIIFGLKELPNNDKPLRNSHIMFGHAFKGQVSGKKLLKKFKSGGGTLYDIEYLTQETGKRVAAFGYWAGFAGAYVALKVWISQLKKEISDYKIKLEVKESELELTKKHLKEQYFGVDIIVGGPPCQGFSKRNMTANDMRYHRMNNLPIVFAKLAISLQPKIVVMEEVASAQEVVDDVADLLEKAGYDVVQTCLNAADYGVPQSRRRIILVASSSDAELIPPSPKNVVSAGSALKKPPVPVRGSVVSPYVRDKIQQLQNANTRLIGGNYSVMDLNRPSPTIHTQTLSATGPYTIKRGRTYYTMSPEEAARLQSFPSNFRFIGSSTSVRRQIGNAVPPMLAKAIASGIRIK